MGQAGSTSIHEQDFCAEVAKWADEIFRSNPLSPFATARVEGFGSGSQRRKRKDLRILNHGGKVTLTGEVKLPGTLEGSSPFDSDLVRDAQTKADNAGAQYFFTWNVNRFVLWDRYQQDKPLLERWIRVWPLGRNLRDAIELARPENLDYIKNKFLPGLLVEIGDIFAGRRTAWQMAPDDLFIRSLESFLDWPVELTRAYLAHQADHSRAFDGRLQEWMAQQNWQFVRRSEAWGEALDRASRTIVYVLSNRLIFYQALRARFPDLPSLRLPPRIKTASDAYAWLQQAFERAVRRSGDYEPLFYPREQDWAGPLVFAQTDALDAWRRALRGIESYDFGHISSDIVGRIFQRLISPEERHRWGQHFTGDDAVDLINAFCIRDSDAAVLDPACGSGSFLARAYYRKQSLSRQKSHLALLSGLFGCEIALYPSHLATLNLAAREINEEANYPRVIRRDFFDVVPDQPFWSLRNETGTVKEEVKLPALDAIVGNPPYVGQETIGRKGKADMTKVVVERWPALKLSGRSDAHCYFWPAAAHFLREGGYFGFLTSSSWLDVEYGFALQRWILENFRIIAIGESEAEPWFEDARVKTCVTILQRCADRGERMAARVKFVQFKRQLASIIGEPADSLNRFHALDALRDMIEGADEAIENGNPRIIVKPQRDLWDEGVRAGRLLKGVASQPATITKDDDEEEETPEQPFELGDKAGYAAGKWGRYVRAPGFYFEVMRKYSSGFVPLGEIADVRFGVKSGCDAFFMPHDITRSALQLHANDADFKKQYGVDRSLVAKGEIKIIRDGNRVEHPIEARYLKPEVHTLRDFQRVEIRAVDCNRVVILVGESLSALKGTYVERYLRYGERETFASGKSKPVPVPKRSTCAARSPWYDMTKLVKPGIAFWPMAHQ